jgi:uracil-DNA glycosylase family 4
MRALSILGKKASTCIQCDLCETRTQVVFGVGSPKADLLFVGEAPGANEDLQGEPFVGRSGKLLDTLVSEELGMDRSQFCIANVVKCRPPNNRDPKPVEIDACWAWLQQQIEIIDPKVIMTLGNFSTRTLLQTKVGITQLRGRVHPFGDRLLVPTFHPAAALRQGADVVAKMRSDLVRAKRALAGDVELVGVS